MNGLLKSPVFCIALSDLGLMGDKFYFILRFGPIRSLSLVVTKEVSSLQVTSSENLGKLISRELCFKLGRIDP